MPSSGPKFSPFPFHRLRRVSASAAALESAVARWIAARPLGVHTARLAGGPVRARMIGAVARGLDPHAALAEVRIGGLALVLAASGRPVRALAQRLLGGPAELDAPRPLTPVEHAVWALALAAALEDAGVAGEVWPLDGEPLRDAWSGEHLAVELAVDVVGSPMTVTALCPPAITVGVPPARAVPAWTFDLPVIVAGCALPRASLRALVVRDVVTLEPRLGLAVGESLIGLRADAGAVEAEVTTSYGARDMALPDHVHLELTVQLGTTRLSLRQLAELAPGQIVPLGRPLAGPFEVHAAGRQVGTGELVDVDGELGVRILSLQE